MQILLKDLLKEATDSNGVTTDSPLKVQIYCDMDGVLADMDKGFKALSGGVSLKDYTDKHGRSSFWKLIAKKHDFWSTLPLMPDAHVLWNYLKDNFKDPVPVVLSAGQGANIIQQKTQWMHQNFGTGIKVILASSGAKKPEYILPNPAGLKGYITHVLIDDTQKNIDAWDNQPLHRIAIFHKSAADSIKALAPFVSDKGNQ